MATTRAQRIGIWIIVVFLAIGTVGSFAIIVVANENAQRDQARVNELSAKYQAESDEYQKKVAAQTKELSDKYYDTFSAYASRATPFDAVSVTELKTEDLVVGDGEEITEDSTFTAYYIGWNPSGTTFDSSIADGSLSTPLSVAPGGVIEGWTKGAAGMKVGGIRELTIPAELAYGDIERSEDIPANTPLKFVIMIIPTPDPIPEPEIPQALLNYYQTGRL
ncbi:FKBP-type peptidyl-prolyl cis-trans isomerase [Candidatus Saccharibacteria bacterium]|nr:FKBP-type peptidyl-prolyl cis-trans isomerase [Candidatus Saccharibacteria bacterium]